MTADILTKSLSKEVFCMLRTMAAGVMKAPGLDLVRRSVENMHSTRPEHLTVLDCYALHSV